jgi:HlyD family type I secretion membrane fusion protein
MNPSEENKEKKIEEKPLEQMPIEDSNLQFKEKPHISKEAYYTGLILISFLLLTIFWAAIAPLDSVSIAQGYITVASSNKMIQHSQGGTIKRVLVNESDTVKAQQVLIELDDAQTFSKLDVLKNGRLFLLAKQARLQAIINGDDHITFPQELEQSDNPSVRNVMRIETSFFEKDNQAHIAELETLTRQLAQLDQQKEQAKQERQGTENQQKFLQEELKAVAYLEKQKLVRKPRLLALQREDARLDAEKGKFVKEVLRIEEQEGETNAKITYNIQNRHQKALSELEESEQKLFELAPQIIAAQNDQDKTLIRTPASGIVKGLKFKSSGEVIRGGDEIMQIVPANDKLVVEVQLNPNDIENVRPGLKAKIQILALSPRYRTNIYGIVEYISPDAFVSEKEHRTYYLVRISNFDEEWKAIANQLVPGMPVEAMIINDQRSVLSYFWSPIRDSFNRAFREK